MKKKLFLKFFIFTVLAIFVTFTSCKDYDDDISKLESGIASLKATVESIQQKIESGSTIAEVVKTDNGINIKLSDGKTYTITNGVAGKDGSVITIGENGNWFIDGKDSGKLSKGTDGKGGVDGKDSGVYYKPGEDGFWHKVDGDTVTPTTDRWMIEGGGITAKYEGGYVVLYNVEGSDEPITIGLVGMNNLVFITDHVTKDGSSVMSFSTLVSTDGGKTLQATAHYQVSPTNATEKLIDKDNLYFKYKNQTVVQSRADGLNLKAEFVSLEHGILTVEASMDPDALKGLVKNGNKTIQLMLVVPLTSGNEVVSDFVKVVSDGKLVYAPFIPSADKWEQNDTYGTLPEYISVYKYKQTVAGKNVQAYIAVADMNNESARFTVLGEKEGSKTPQKFYTDNAKPNVVLNGGYFWAGRSLGTLVRNGKTISSQEPTYRNYNGASTPYYPTQGVFGMDNNRIFSAHYGYPSGSVINTYPIVSPNKAGDKPQAVPSKNFPAKAKEWTPTEAIGAGPLLIKDGVYKNNWEAELFDSFSGIGPTANQPRSAVAYHPSGHVVFFVCEGRNKTPLTPGLTLKDMADLFLDLGCTDAINLDGGGSSCMLINGKETIIPSDDAKQRSVTNAIALY